MRWVDGVIRETKIQFAENKKFVGMAIFAVVLTIAATITTMWGLYVHSGVLPTSFIITVGLQGFLLVLAWTLGEAMATELNASPTKKKGLSTGFLGGLFFLAITAAIFLCAIGQIDGLAMIGVILGAAIGWTLLSVPRHVATMAVYLLVMGVSVFFSFDFHYLGFKPIKTRMKDAATIAQKDVEAGRRQLFDDVERELQEDRANVVNGAEWRAYKQTVDAVAKLAETQNDALAEIIRAKEQDAQGRLRAADARREELRKRSEEIRTRKVEIGPEIERLEAEEARLMPEVAAKRGPKEQTDTSVALKVKEIAQEIRGGNEGRKRKCGTFCIRQKEELRILRQQQAKLNGEFEIAEKRLIGIQRELARLRQELATADGRADSVANEQGIEDTRLEQAKLELERQKSSQGVDISAAKGLSRITEKYRNDPTEPALAALRGQCDDLVKAMRGIEGVNVPADVDCSPGAYATTAKNYFDRRAENEAFQQACSPQNVQAAGRVPTASGAESPKGAPSELREPVNDAEQRLVFDALVRIGQACASLAPLKASTSGQRFRETLTDLKLETDPGANNMIASNVAALRRADYQALLALFIAITIDALILFAAIFGARANVRPISFRGEKTPEENQKDYDNALKVDPRLADVGPPEVQKARLILSNLTFHPGGDADGDDGGDAKYPAWIDFASLSDDHRTLVGQTLMSFKPFTKLDPETGRLLLHERFIHELQGQVVRWQRREAADGRAAAMSFGGATRTRRASWPPIVAVEPRDVRPDIYFEDLLKAATPPRKQADGSGKKASNGADDPESFMRKEGKAGKPV